MKWADVQSDKQKDELCRIGRMPHGNGISVYPYMHFNISQNFAAIIAQRAMMAAWVLKTPKAGDHGILVLSFGKCKNLHNLDKIRIS